MLESLLAALIPVGVETSKALINKFLGKKDLTPATFEEGIQLANLDIDRLKAISDLENTGQTYLWVEAIRKLQRPFVTLIVLCIWAYGNIANWSDMDSINKLAGMIFFYLFGDRSAAYIFNRSKHD